MTDSTIIIWFIFTFLLYFNLYRRMKKVEKVNNIIIKSVEEITPMIEEAAEKLKIVLPELATRDLRQGQNLDKPLGSD